MRTLFLPLPVRVSEGSQICLFFPVIVMERHMEGLSLLDEEDRGIFFDAERGKNVGQISIFVSLEGF